MYAQSRLFSIQLVAQVALTLVFFILRVNSTAQAIFCGMLLYVVGIPHGSNDYLYRPDQTVAGMFKFLGAYLGTMAVYATLWWFVPALAFVLFFFISFHHFGQSNFENDTLWYPPSWLWGLWILAFPVLLHFDEAVSIFRQMIDVTPSDPAITPLLPTTVPLKTWQWIGSISIGIAYLAALFFYQPKNKLRYVMQFVAVTTWYILMPLLSGFVVVFCLWHSLQSFRHQSQYYQTRYGKGLWPFVKAMLPFTLIALMAFGVYVYLREFKISEAFIMLSLITLPHVLVMHHLYHHTNESPQTGITPSTS